MTPPAGTLQGQNRKIIRGQIGFGGGGHSRADFPLVVECLGGITLVVGAVTESPVFMGIGGAAMAVGVGSVLPVAFSHSSEDMYYFKYVEQVTNDDLFEKTFLEPEEK